MKKIYVPCIALIAILTFVLFSSIKVSANNDSGNPFQEIWNVIRNIQEQISNIELMPGPQGEPGPSTFPTPDFNSGWIIIPPKTAVIDIHHDVGGDINDYFIEATYMRDNNSFSSHETAADKIWWEDVEPNNIQVATNGDVTNLYKAVRIRIWRIR